MGYEITNEVHECTNEDINSRMGYEMMKAPILSRNDLIYPELSYKIIGASFSVFNELGYGYRELYYQRALVAEFERAGIPFRTEVCVPVLFNGKAIGQQRLDFIIDDSVILELKQGNHIGRRDIAQVMGYLRATGLQLAILARFSSKGLIFKRILNLQN